MTAQEQFWRWFVQHDDELYDFDPTKIAERETLFGELAAQLQQVDPNLAFEFGPRDTRREFVISAGGISDAFPAVTSLVNVAPSLDRWRVIAFRPRRAPLHVVNFGGKSVDPEHVQFSLLDNGKTVGIYLFIPGFLESDVDLKQIGYLLLDGTLGEYDVESRLGLIKMIPPETRTDGDRYPLADLPALFDELVARLEGRTGMPS